MSDVVAKTPPQTLTEQLALIDVSDDQHDANVEIAAENATNPTDTFGRTAYEVAQLKQAGFMIVPAMKCTNCGESLTWCRGVPEKVAAHFRHRSKTKCPGGYMTPWHAAMQLACAAKGFDTERRIVVDDVVRRLDAYHAGKRLCLEFVNSLSANYIVKHSQLVSYPIVTAWFFNSGSRFATNAHEERADVAALESGIIRIQNLFRDEGGAREIIEQIGRINCYTIYRGLVFGCVGYDLWECLPLCNPLQKLCVSDRGFNFQLFAAGKMPRRHIRTGAPTGQMRVVRSRYPLPDGHAVDPEYLLNDLRTEVATGKLPRASALFARKPQLSQQEGGSDISLKLPSDNDPQKCDGMPRATGWTNNLAIAEVQEQIEKAKLSWDGDDFDPWPTDRPTDISVEEPEDAEPLLTPKPAQKNEDVGGPPAALLTLQNNFGDSNKFMRTIAPKVPTHPWRSDPSCSLSPPQLNSVGEVNRVLQEIANNRRFLQMPAYYQNNY